MTVTRDETLTSARSLSEGRVVSKKMHKTCIVEVMRRVKHKVGKYVWRSTRIAVHDEENVAKEGDIVSFYETKPISKTKTAAIHAVLEKNSV